MALENKSLQALFCEPQGRVFTMAPYRPFLIDLARALLSKYADQPTDLAQVMVFLPTRRAARALGEAFLTVAGAAPAATLLPRIRTLGDLGDDDFLADSMAGVSAEQGQPFADLAPAISSLERRLILARFIHRHKQWLDKMGGASARWSVALHAADELASMLDSFYTEQISFEELAALVPEQFSQHWQNSLKFLKIITEEWPDYLAARDCLDPADHRRLLIDRLSASWCPEQGGRPPRHPVLIAGSTGSMPAVARLMRLVANLPQGAVLLPGLDCTLDDAAWQEIEDPHPQAGLKCLLEKYFEDLPRSAVPAWPTLEEGVVQADYRSELLSLALRPAKATDDWHLQVQEAQTVLKSAVEGLSLVEAMDEASEAQIIALAMREALEVPGKRSILVTPDRGLARRVSARLERWGIRLDDSAGVPFANSLRGNFLRLVATWLADVSDPVGLLCLLKHPLCRAGMGGSEFAVCVQALDLSLRGLRPGPGFDGLRAHLTTGSAWDALCLRGQDEELPDRRAQENAARWKLLSPLIDRLEEIAAPFLLSGVTMKALLAGHIAAAEKLCAGGREGGAARLWAYEDGEVGAALMARLDEQIDLLPEIEKGEYSDVFESLIAGVPVRLRGGSHPRLLILGPLEARLQQADLIILGGLNERIWPDDSKADAFLSRPMRAQLGLPSHQRRVGLSAHDFAQNASAVEVLLTRAKRVGRSPTKPSRWVVRLKNILKKAQLLDALDQTQRYETWAKAMDAPEKMQLINPPAPCPPAAARPRHLPVTAIEKLLRDPYAIFASRILKLYPLDELDIDPSYAIRGRFYHSVFAQFAYDYAQEMPTSPVTILHKRADQLFERTRLNGSVQAFWRARMAVSFEWFVRFHAQMMQVGHAKVVEGKGRWAFPLGGENFTLEARADRIDLCPDGAFIIDYKTGAIPTGRQDKTFVPQLPLTALIVAENGFADLLTQDVAGYAYIKVLNRKDGDDLRGDNMWVDGATVRDAMADTKASLMHLLQHYANPSTPYLSQPRPFYRDDYGTYDDLARRGEWLTEMEDE